MVDVKKLLEGDVILGPRACMRKLRSGAAHHIYVASNCFFLEEIERFASLSGVMVERLDMTAQELGALCKRHFSVSVLCV